jgi:hypothetical protein
MPDKDLIQYAFKTLVEHSIYMKATLFVVVALVIISLGVKHFVEIVTGIKSLIKKDKKEKPAFSLGSHSVFTQLNYWSQHKINTLQFGNPQRNVIFRSIMSTKLSIMGDMLNTIIKEINDKPDMVKDEFKSMSVCNFSKGIRQFDMIMKEQHGKEIFNLVIDGDKGYNHWEENLMIYTRTMTDSICDSDIYNNNIERGIAMLSVYQAVVDTIITVVENTFHSFNGDLDKILDKEKK